MPIRQTKGRVKFSYGMFASGQMAASSLGDIQNKKPEDIRKAFPRMHDPNGRRHEHSFIFGHVVKVCTKCGHTEDL
jgi:hypothetical protein